jgi:CTP:molybdopterin cytidylyltransferase MocA
MSRAYLLAAGRGKRAGGPKAWLEHDGKPLLARQLEFAGKHFGPENVAVSIQKEWIERCGSLSPAARWVSVDPDASPLASLQSLLRASPAASPFFIWHVDQPVWDEKLFAELEETLSAGFKDGHYAAEGVKPCYDGHGGHPVLLAPELALRILALNPVSERLDVFLQSREMLQHPVASACCVENWNQGAPA